MSTKKRTLRLAALTAVTTAALFQLPAVAEADTEVEHSISRIASGRNGSEVKVGETTVPADVVGQTCSVSFMSGNSESVHKDNHLIIRSGDAQATLEDVEAEVGAEFENAASLTVTDTIEFFIQLGPDSVTSIDADISLNCAELVANTPPQNSLVDTTTPPTLVEVTPKSTPIRAITATPTFTG